MATRSKRSDKTPPKVFKAGDTGIVSERNPTKLANMIDGCAVTVQHPARGGSVVVVVDSATNPSKHVGTWSIPATALLPKP